MTKICCAFVALFTLGGDKPRPCRRSGGLRSSAFPAVNRRSDCLGVRSKAHIAILPPLTLTEESSVYGKRIIAAAAVPLLGF
jgi:hypothetical protein